MSHADFDFVVVGVAPRGRLPPMICPARAGGFYCWTAKAGLSHVAVRYRRA